MELNNDLITQFAKITKISTNNKDATTVRGTIHIVDGQYYIRLDGAAENVLTPVETTVEINEGDRVIAAVKDHSLVVTGNKTNPSVGTVTAGNLSTEIEQTAERITSKATADYNDLNGKITDEATARANGDTGLGNRITKAETLITQTATEIRSEAKADYDTLNGKITDEATARANGDSGLGSRITKAESLISQTATEIRSEVKADYDTLNGKITDEATARANGDDSIGKRLTNAESRITQTATEITSTVTANYNTLNGKIDTEMSKITQTANAITSRVETVEGQNEVFSEFKQTVEGFSFMGNGGTVKLSGGDINLTGSITWDDFTPEGKVQMVVDIAEGIEPRLEETEGVAWDAYNTAVDAMSVASSNSIPGYITSTSINGARIESPTIIGGTIYAVGSDPNALSTFTTMDENGFYIYNKASKPETTGANLIYPKISFYCDESSEYINPMIILGSGESDEHQFHNRFVIEKSGKYVDMRYRFDYSYTECGFRFNQNGNIDVIGNLNIDIPSSNQAADLPIGTILLNTNGINPASYLVGDWERIDAAFLYMTGDNNKLDEPMSHGSVTTNSVASGVPYRCVVGWERVM